VPGANNAGISEQALNVGFSEARDLHRVKSLERFAKSVSLPQDDDPGQPGLKSFEHQQFPECPAVAHRHAPLRVMVFAH